MLFRSWDKVKKRSLEKDHSNITVIEKHVLLQVCFSSVVQWPLHKFYSSLKFSPIIHCRVRGQGLLIFLCERWERKWGGGGGEGVLTCLCEMPQVIATSVIHDSANIIPFERKEVCLRFGQEMKNDKYNYYDMIKNFCP